jgi:hypothetical protein
MLPNIDVTGERVRNVGDARATQMLGQAVPQSAVSGKSYIGRLARSMSSPAPSRPRIFGAYRAMMLLRCFLGNI